jgi:uncharacterized OB-fold protein
MTTEAPPKPLPLPDEDSKPFYDGAAEGKLMLMRCTACGTARIPSRHHCDECLSADFEWFEASGRGTVRTFGVMHQRYHPGFADDIPYVVAIIELEEGPRMPANIIDTPTSEVRVGMEVSVAWEKHADVTIPRFRPLAN